MTQKSSIFHNEVLIYEMLPHVSLEGNGCQNCVVKCFCYIYFLQLLTKNIYLGEKQTKHGRFYGFSHLYACCFQILSHLCLFTG